MIFSRSAEYAIRAFVYLAEIEDGQYSLVKNIAKDLDIPGHFLAKILQQMARKGFLRSSKGPTGGFMLCQPAREISLLQILEAIDGLSEYERCPNGLAECNDEMVCGMHDSWIQLRSRIIEYLEGTSIADVAAALAHKRQVLGKQGKPRRSSKKN